MSDLLGKGLIDILKMARCYLFVKYWSQAEMQTFPRGLMFLRHAIGPGLMGLCRLAIPTRLLSMLFHVS